MLKLAIAVMLLATADSAFAEVHVDQSAKGELMALSGLAVDSKGCTPLTTSGKIVKRDFAPDAMTLVSITLEEAGGRRSRYNVAPPPQDLSAELRAKVTAGLQLFTRVGRMVSISAYACGTGEKILNLDAIK